MGQIPLGNFDAPNVQPRQREGAPDLGNALAAPGRALEQLGNQGMQIADHEIALQNEKKQRKFNEAKQQDRALKQIQILNAAGDVEIQTRQEAANTIGDLQTGRVNYAKADEEFQNNISKIAPPVIDGLDPAQAEQYAGAVRQHRMAAGLMIDGAVRGAKLDAGRAQLGQTLDTFGKNVAMGQDPDKAVAIVRAAMPSFRLFGFDEATLNKTVQDWSDKLYTNHAQAADTAAGDDLGKIAALRHDLTDPNGYYANKLDADKINAIDRNLANHAESIQNRNEHHADRQAGIQGRALDQMDAQSASGYPPTAEQRTAWAGIFPPGSASRSEYDARLQGEADAQTFLRKPINEQVAGLAAEQSKMLTEGADPHDRANFAHKQTIVNANIKMLVNAPLQFAASHMATPLEPIDAQSLADPAQAGAIAAKLQTRASTVAALQKQYGGSVKNNLLLPEEVKTVAAALDKMPPKKAADMFGALFKTVGSPSNYDAVMGQLAPDNPVLAQAGRLSAAQRLYSSDNNNPLISNNVAATMLKGDALLNATKDDKATDGNPKAYPMPPDKDMRATFAEQVGTAYAGDPKRFERDYQFVRAYYAGRTAETGKISNDIDERIVRDAVTATIGEITDVGGRSVAMPWGMSASTFEKGWQAAATTALAGYDAQTIRNNLDGSQLMQLPNSGYLLVHGAAPVLDKNGRPVSFRVPRQ